MEQMRVKEDSGNNEHKISNSIFHQVVAYILVLFFICVTVLSVFWVISLVKSEGLTTGIVGSAGIYVLLFFAGYASYVGLLTLRYRSAKVTYGEKGFTVTSRGHFQEYLWSDIVKTKYYGIVKVLRLSNNKGKTIYTIHGITYNNREFIRKVGKTVGYTIDLF